MGAVGYYLESQLIESLQKATGLVVGSVEVTRDPPEVTVRFELDGPGASQPFWEAVKEAYD